jgi:hypothetical protein
MSIKKPFILLLCAIFAITIIVYFSVSASVGETIAEKAGYNIKIAVVTDVGDDKAVEFLEQLIRHDKKGILAENPSADNIAVADVNIFIIAKWDDAMELPHQDSFFQLYEKVEQAEKEAAQIVFEILVNGGKPMAVIFYNRSVIGDIPMTCYAIKTLFLIDHNENEEALTFAECAKVYTDN